MKLKLQHLWAFLPLALGFLGASSLFQVLPQIMHDEYIYASQARHLPFSEHPYSNYLFSWVMGVTKLCSPEFYSCAKLINATMYLVGVLFTLLIAVRLLTFGWAVFVASVTALSPLVIQTSFFMPETMYFMAMTISLWVALWATSQDRMWVWAISGVALGMSALVKPHALFILPAFMAFAFLVQLRKSENSQVKSLATGAFVLGGFLIAKLGLGFAFAGPAGLRLFGGYGSPVEGISRVVSDVGGSEGGGPSAIEVLLTVAGTHLLAHISVMALLAGLPLLLALRVLGRVLRTKQEIGLSSSFMILIALVTLSMLALVPTFEAYVTASGDDHSLRLILRYYEFLIPSFLIAALLMDRFVEPTRALRWIQAALVAILSVGFAWLYPPLVDTKFADSSFLSGLEDAPTIFLALSLVAAVSAIYWALNPDRGALAIARIAAPITIVLSMFLSQSLLVSSSSSLAYFDVAGKAAAPVLEDKSGSDIAVVGQARTHVFTAMFWIDKAEISQLYVSEGETLDMDTLSEARYYLVLGNLNIIGGFRELTAGENFTLIEKTNSPTN